MSRILGKQVQPLWPDETETRVLIYGEAPGPLGADKTGIPFYGDRCGKVLYGVLNSLSVLTYSSKVSDGVSPTKDWSVSNLVKWQPHLEWVALSNVYDRCPTEDGQTFRAPKQCEVAHQTNILRLRDEVLKAKPKLILALGRVAEHYLSVLLPEAWTAPRGLDFKLTYLRHPSPQSIAGMGKNGLETWSRQFRSLLQSYIPTTCPQCKSLQDFSLVSIEKDKVFAGASFETWSCNSCKNTIQRRYSEKDPWLV